MRKQITSEARDKALETLIQSLTRLCQNTSDSTIYFAPAEILRGSMKRDRDYGLLETEDVKKLLEPEVQKGTVQKIVLHKVRHRDSGYRIFPEGDIFIYNGSLEEANKRFGAGLDRWIFAPEHHYVTGSYVLGNSSRAIPSEVHDELRRQNYNGLVNARIIESVRINGDPCFRVEGIPIVRTR